MALRIITERELEIEKFNPEEYWSLKGTFNKNMDKEFDGRLIKINEKKIDKLTIKNENDASNISRRKLIKVNFRRNTKKRNKKKSLCSLYYFKSANCSKSHPES